MTREDDTKDTSTTSGSKTTTTTTKDTVVTEKTSSNELVKLVKGCLICIAVIIAVMGGYVFYALQRTDAMTNENRVRNELTTDALRCYAAAEASFNQALASVLVVALGDEDTDVDTPIEVETIAKAIVTMREYIETEGQDACNLEELR